MVRVSSYIYWVLVVVWMLVIFGLSSQTGGESSAFSRGVSSKIATGSVKVKKIAVVKRTNGVENSVVPQQSASVVKREQWKAKTRLDRKTRDAAHCVLYFVLGVLVFFAFRSSGLCLWKSFVFTIVFCVLYSITDEWHQSFVPGRGPELNDALLDLVGSSSGAILGIISSLVKKSFIRI